MIMITMTFTLPDEKAAQLTAAAGDVGVPVEDLLQRITDDFLARKEGFQTAMEYVLQKNAELYRRLAK